MSFYKRYYKYSKRNGCSILLAHLTSKTLTASVQSLNNKRKNKQMKLNKVDTQLGIKFNVVEFEDADTVVLVNDAGKVSRVTDCLNADRRQKIALVDARAWLSALIGDGYTPEGEDTWPEIKGLGFSRAVIGQKGTGDEKVDILETEKTHIDRFVAALASGQFTPDGFTITGSTDEAKEASATAFLQSLANKCGDKEFEGHRCFILNLDQAVRKAGGGLIPKGAMETAENIFKIEDKGKRKERLEHWDSQFTNGYKSAKGVQIDPIVHDSFLEKVAKDSTPEQKEQHHQLMVRRLAKCIHQARTQERQKTEVSLKEEFC